MADLCRKHGVSDASVYEWKARYGGMDVSEGRQCCAIGPSDNGGAAEGLRGREHPPETAAGRCNAQTTLPSRTSWEKVVTPAAKRQAVASGGGPRDERAAGVPGDRLLPDDHALRGCPAGRSRAAGAAAGTGAGPGAGAPQVRLPIGRQVPDGECVHSPDGQRIACNHRKAAACVPAARGA